LTDSRVLNSGGHSKIFIRPNRAVDLADQSAVEHARVIERQIAGIVDELWMLDRRAEPQPLVTATGSSGDSHTAAAVLRRYGCGNIVWWWSPTRPDRRCSYDHV
jgi:hypothetical protein